MSEEDGVRMGKTGETAFRVAAAAATEKGFHLVNQDAFLVDLQHRIFAVADGVTVARGDSSRASRAAVSLLRGGGLDDLRDAFDHIAEKIRTLPQAGATTLTALAVRGREADVCHAGDSCLFLVRRGIRKITDDDAAPGTNVLTQAIGHRPLRPHRYRFRLKPGDRLLLMTDGVAKHLTSREMAQAARRPLHDMPALLITAAAQKRKLYEDDKTVVAVAIT